MNLNNSLEKTIKIKYIKVSSRKIRPILVFLKGKNILQVISFLTFFPNKSSFIILNLIKVLFNKFQFLYSRVYILELIVQEASFLKRFRPRAQGKSFPFKRHFCHIIIYFLNLLSFIVFYNF